ncbi:ATP-binding cassette domain-containing protein [Collinsella sp. An2]|uniref:ABC transporter ATP-binding protein n=1 Tax=Collinsella sp. An2 TaxID=1965585 RepID=UPI000B397712|nr:ATP-binding cassette domain-containing protein [Collinsella sp. An2]OUP06479.1 multidrug ABC transporter ATP-binding protein [Collinsella sp. An2]
MRLVIRSYTKQFRHNTVLDDITASFESGTIYGLQGKNGSGKTMLMRALSGLIRPTSGTVEVDGVPLGKDFDMLPSVGVLLESPTFLDSYTGLRNLETIASIRQVAHRKQLEDTLRRVGLDPLDKRPYRKYSLGMKQRLGIACAIMESPDVVMLDEPFNALDASGISLTRTIIREEKERGALVILACHDAQELANLADEILVIEQGRLVSVIDDVRKGVENGDGL